MQRYSITVVSESSIIFRRYSKAVSVDEIKSTAYWEGDNLILPALNINQCFRTAFRFLGAPVPIFPDTASPAYFVDENGNKVTKVIPDSRRVKEKGEWVLRHRARLDSWFLKFIVNTEMDAVAVERFINYCGVRVGLCEYRPETQGLYGRFSLATMEML